MPDLKVYLIRHAQSVENVRDMRERLSVDDFITLVRRSPAAPLTPLGEIQARAVVQKLQGAAIEQLYCSPFARAMSTARILGTALGLMPQVVEELREVLPRRPPLTRGNSSLRRHFVRAYLELFWPWGEEEGWARGYQRVSQAWTRITATPYAEVAAVAHRGSIALMLLVARRRGWRILSSDLSNGGVSTILVTNRRPYPAGSPS